MADVIFLTALVAFFALAALLVRACDIIIGPAADAGASEPLNEAADRPVADSPV